MVDKLRRVPVSAIQDGRQGFLNQPSRTGDRKPRKALARQVCPEQTNLQGGTLQNGQTVTSQRLIAGASLDTLARRDLCWRDRRLGRRMLRAEGEAEDD